MSNKYVLALLCTLCIAICGYTQEDTLSEKTMGEVIISVNKWEQKLNEVPNKIVKINKLDILRNNPQTSADLLAKQVRYLFKKAS